MTMDSPSCNRYSVPSMVILLETTYSNQKEVVMKKKKELNPIKEQELDQVQVV